MDTRPSILLADDDASVAAVVARALEPVNCELTTASSGPEALASAERRIPDLVLLDVGMPGLSGWGVLARLRENPATRTTPVMMLTGCGRVEEKVEGFGLGADDYVTKPFSLDELRARVFGLLRRHREVLSVHPLTRLPGSPSIEAEIERRIRETTPFGFLYADIDRFKTFNDAYGYARGDEAIRATARALQDSIRQAGDNDGFLGHIGGDDFAIVCSEERAPLVAVLATRRFDALAPSLHDPADVERGWIESLNRRGEAQRSALISLTIGGVTTQRRRLDCYAKVAGIASEMKSWAKSQHNAAPSTWAFDRRRDPPELLS